MKKIGIFAGIIIFISVVISGFFYSKIYSNNIQKEGYLYIPSHTSFEKLTPLVHPFIKNINSFIWVAKKKNYPNQIKAGRYKISKGMNNNELVNMLRSGQQEAVKLSFNNQETLEKLAGRISQQIEPDSVTLLKAFTYDHFLKNNNFNSHTAIAMYIPNSYNVYWNVSATQFRDRMLKEYNRFWNTKRKKQAAKQYLTPKEVITLASIVQKESSTKSEQATIAGLYLNRLRNGWALQSDPTVIYAIKQHKGIASPIKRVLLKDLQIESPYNTYKYKGLPPGPITMPDISTINAVLNAQKHNYFYMCASTTNIGKHLFSKSLAQHNRNAAKYQAWLNKQRVMR